MVDSDQCLVVVNVGREPIVDSVRPQRWIRYPVIKDEYRSRGEVRAGDLVVGIHATGERVFQLRTQRRKIARLLGGSGHHLVYGSWNLVTARSLVREKE